MTSRSESTAFHHFRLAALIVLALTIVRLVGLRMSAVDLFIDESQYWSWSRELALGYFSKPPLLAWLIAAAEHFCGPSEACIRVPAPLMSLATSLLAYAVGRALYDARTGFWAAMLTAFGTGTVFSARIISTDVPLVLFWALALFAYVRLVQKAGWRWAVVLGTALGAGLLAKYAMIYFLAGFVLAAFFEKQARVLLVKPELRLALGLAVITVSPNILWNAANGFLTLRHAGGNVIGEPIEPSVIRPLEFLAAQFAVFGPVVFGVAIVAITFLARGAIACGVALPFPPSPLAGEGRRCHSVCGGPIASNRLMPADRILLGFALPPLIVVTVTASMVHAYANWAAAAFIPLAVLAAAILVRRNLWILLWGSLALGLAVQIAFIGADAFASSIRLPFFSTPNPYFRTLGWNGYGRTVGRLARSLGASTIVSDTRAEVASLLYYWRDQPEQILAWPTTNLPNFDLTRGLTAAAPPPVLFVSQCPATDRLEKYYAKVMPLGIFASDDPTPRGFAAFKLEQPRGPIGPLAECQPG